MNGIRRVRHILARRASSPGRAGLRASQSQGQDPHLARGPGRSGFAARFIQALTAGPSVTAGHNKPALATANSARRTMTVPCLLPRTIQLCIHCRHNPAGFWVSRNSGQTARRPWCLSCCQNLDQRCYRVQPFDG